MGTMPDQMVVEIQKHVNALIHELAFEGCRVEVPMVKVDVYRKVA